MLFFSFFGLLVMYSNITDYTTNYEYLSHILSMDTIDASSRYSERLPPPYSSTGFTG
jgi:predicted small integral membrane protein